MKYIEAFQAGSGGSGGSGGDAAPAAAPAPAPAPVRTCPEGAITSFPLQLNNITPTKELYERIDSPQPPIDIKWATRTNPPTFVAVNDGTALLDEVGAGTNISLSTLRYNEINYKLESIYITRATHNAWLLDANNRPTNKEDILFTFVSDNEYIAYKRLLFVIPVMRSIGGSQPPYLRGIADSSMKVEFSPSQCFPQRENTKFIYYATCLAGYDEAASSTNIMVFVAYEGLAINSELMDNVRRAWNSSKTDFPLASAPFMSSFQKLKISVTMTDITDKKVGSTDTLLSKEAAVRSRGMTGAVREDETGAYQCVPFDPDAEVGPDGKMRVDLDTGLLVDPTKGGQKLDGVLEQVNTVRAESGITASVMAAGRIERFLSWGLGVFLALLFSGGLLYLLFTWLAGRATSRGDEALAAAAAAATVASTGLAIPTPLQTAPPGLTGMQRWAVYGIGFLLTLLLGFILGSVIS